MQKHWDAVQKRQIQQAVILAGSGKIGFVSPGLLLPEQSEGQENEMQLCRDTKKDRPGAGTSEGGKGKEYI